MCIWHMQLRQKVVVQKIRKFPISVEMQLSAIAARIKHTAHVMWIGLRLIHTCRSGLWITVNSAVDCINPEIGFFLCNRSSTCLPRLNWLTGGSSTTRLCRATMGPSTASRASRGRSTTRSSSARWTTSSARARRRKHSTSTVSHFRPLCILFLKMPLFIYFRPFLVTI